MRNIFTALVLGIALSSVSLAQNSYKPAQRAASSDRTRIAVVEFTPGPNASTMTVEGKRQLQASIAFSLFSSKKFDVVDVRNASSK